MIERLPSGVNFYRLLEARPGLTEHLAAILSHAPALAEQLGRRPELLDGLIDASAFAPAPPVDGADRGFRPRRTAADEDYQLLLDRVRRRVNERRFALGAQLVAGADRPARRRPKAMRGSPRRRSACSPTPTIAEFEQAHGRVPGSRAGDPRPRPARRRGADPRLRSRPHLSVQRRPRGGIGRAASRCARPIISTGWRRGSPPRSACRPRPGRSTRSTRGCGRRARTGCSPSRSRASPPISASKAWTCEHMALTRARPVFGSAAARAALAGGDRRRCCGRTRDPARARRRRGADARRDGARTSRRAGRSTSSWSTAGWSISNSRSRRCSSRTASGLDPAFPGRARGADRAPAWSRAEIDGHYRLLHDMLVMLRLVSPNSAEPPDGVARAGRPGLRPGRLGRRCLRATPRRGRASARCGARSPSAEEA